MNIDIIKGSEIIIDSKPIELPIDKLQLDPYNVRFQHLPKRMTDEEIEKFIWEEEKSDITELYRQILAAKGLYEEPIVDSDFIIKEGNRRIICLRKLKNEAHNGKLPGFSPHHFDKVKCLVLPKNISQKDIDLLLATKHVKGKKPWNAFNKANHIFNLHDIHGLSYDFISKYLGMGKITVIRMVDVYKATENYGKRYPSDKDWFRNFTYFDELYKRRDLKEFRENPKNIEKFTEWVHNKKFIDVRDVRFLAKILVDKEALEIMERKKFADARLIVESKDPTVVSPEFKKIKETIDIIRSFSRKELVKTLNDASRIRLLQSLKKEITDLIKDIESMEKIKT